MIVAEQQSRFYSFFRLFRIALGIAILAFMHYNQNIPQIYSLLGNIVSLILVFPIVFVYFDLYEKMFPDTESHPNGCMNINFIDEEKKEIENADTVDTLN